jgi:hypothetical protein
VQFFFSRFSKPKVRTKTINTTCEYGDRIKFTETKIKTKLVGKQFSKPVLNDFNRAWLGLWELHVANRGGRLILIRSADNESKRPHSAVLMDTKIDITCP